jgi:hypothetical protein
MSSINDDWFIIKDFEGLIEATRALVFNSFGSETKEKDKDDFIMSVTDKDIQELDKVLSYDESLAIIVGFLKKEKNKKTSKIRYLVNDDSYMKIIYALNDRMTSNILNGLVNKGLVETAYDDESNDFVFWVKEDEDENKNKNPETN